MIWCTKNSLQLSRITCACIHHGVYPIFTLGERRRLIRTASAALWDWRTQTKQSHLRVPGNLSCVHRAWEETGALTGHRRTWELHVECIFLLGSCREVIASVTACRRKRLQTASFPTLGGALLSHWIISLSRWIIQTLGLPVLLFYTKLICNSRSPFHYCPQVFSLGCNSSFDTTRACDVHLTFSESGYSPLMSCPSSPLCPIF